MNFLHLQFPKLISVFGASALLAGCYTMPQGSYPDGQSRGYGGNQNAGGEATASVGGCWRFTGSRGRQRVNRVERLDDSTILVTPTTGRKSFEYIRISYGYYQDVAGTGTYRFTNSAAIWRSNSDKSKTIRLTFSGDRC